MLDALRERLHLEHRARADDEERALAGTGKRDVLRLPEHELLAAPDRGNRPEMIAARTEDLDAEVRGHIHAPLAVDSQAVRAVVFSEQRVLVTGHPEAFVAREVAPVGKSPIARG